MKYVLLFLLCIHLTHGQEPILYQAPVWSPDGTQICFISNESGSTEIYLKNVVVEGISQLTDDTLKKWTPTWSPDGTKIAFVAEFDGNKELCYYDIAVQTTTRITNTPTDESMPSWHPSSKSLVYISSAEGSPNQIRETTLDGKSHGLAQRSDTTYIYPSFSSDGTQLLYCSKPFEGTQQFHIAILNLETGEETPLETMGRVSYNPSWACNDTKIIFVNQETVDIQSASIVLMNSDGTSTEKMIECEGGCFQPKMNSDCNQVAYRNGWVANHKGIFSFDSGTHKSTNLIGSR